MYAETTEGAQKEIHRFFDLALSGFPPGSLPTRNKGYFEAHYLADELTRLQCALFDRAIPAGKASQ